MVSERLRSLANVECGSGASEEDITQAEAELRVVLPRSYRSFLRRFGWATVEDWELFGLGGDVPPYLDLIRNTYSERTEAFPPLPVELVPIMNDGGGNLYCLDTRQAKGGTCVVAFWDHTLGSDQAPVVEAEDFAEWLYQRVEEAER